MNSDNSTIKLLYETKSYILNTIQKTDNINEKLEYINKLKELEEKILYFTNLNNNIHIKTENKNNTNSYNITRNSIFTTNKNKKSSNNKNDSNNEKIITQNSCDIQKQIDYYDEEIDINIKYTYQTQSKNFIFYKCKKRPMCKGRCKINKLNNELIIIEKCNENIDHEDITFEQFYLFYKKKQFKNIKPFFFAWGFTTLYNIQISNRSKNFHANPKG